jgi:hypothetical protein
MKALRPLKAIRAKCLDCCGGSVAEVKLCETEDCPLWAFRMGHNPQRKGLGGCPAGQGQEMCEKTLTHVGGNGEEEAIP